MTLRKLNRPFTFNNDFDQFFNDFFQSPTVSKGAKKVSWGAVPAVNIQETEEGYDISVAAPGMNKEDFKIELNEGVMSISSETKSEKEDTNDNFTRREFNYSSFERRFTIPENVKEEDVKASYSDGILKIEIPKMKEEEQKETKKLITIS